MSKRLIATVVGLMLVTGCASTSSKDGPGVSTGMGQCATIGDTVHVAGTDMAALTATATQADITQVEYDLGKMAMSLTLYGDPIGASLATSLEKDMETLDPSAIQRDGLALIAQLNIDNKECK